MINLFVKGQTTNCGYFISRPISAIDFHRKICKDICGNLIVMDVSEIQDSLVWCEFVIECYSNIFINLYDTIPINISFPPYINMDLINNSLEKIPNEIIYHIFKYIPIIYAYNTMLVCKKFHEIGMHLYLSNINKYEKMSQIMGTNNGAAMSILYDNTFDLIYFFQTCRGGSLSSSKKSINNLLKLYNGPLHIIYDLMNIENFPLACIFYLVENCKNNIIRNHYLFNIILICIFRETNLNYIQSVVDKYNFRRDQHIYLLNVFLIRDLTFAYPILSNILTKKIENITELLETKKRNHRKFYLHLIRNIEISPKVANNDFIWACKKLDEEIALVLYDTTQIEKKVIRRCIQSLSDKMKSTKWKNDIPKINNFYQLIRELVSS